MYLYRYFNATIIINQALYSFVQPFLSNAYITHMDIL